MGRSPIRIQHFRIGRLRQAARDFFARALVTRVMDGNGDGVEPTRVRSKDVPGVASLAGSGSPAGVRPSPAKGNPAPAAATRSSRSDSSWRTLPLAASRLVCIVSIFSRSAAISVAFAPPPRSGAAERGRSRVGVRRDPRLVERGA